MEGLPCLTPTALAQMTVVWDRGGRSARKGVETAFVGCDAELDGDGGKGAPRMAPGMCSGDVLSSGHSAASSGVLFFADFFPLSIVCARKAWEQASKRECLNTYGVSMQWNAVEPE